MNSIDAEQNSKYRFFGKPKFMTKKRALIGVFIVARLLIPTNIIAQGARAYYSPEEIAAKLRVSTAVIRCLTEDERSVTGSGFVVGKGLIATNAHVVDSCRTISVQISQSGPAASANVARIDAQRDIALLRVPSLNAPAVIFGSTRNIAPGTPILAVGHPRGLTYTVSDGIVSAIRELGPGWKLVQITAPISPGSSGGPVADRTGRVIGMSAMQLEDGQNLNFAVAVEDIMQIIAEDARQIPSVSGQNEALRRRWIEVLKHMKEAYESGKRLLALHEIEKQRVYEEYLQRRELYNQGLLSRAEVAQAERALARAILRVDEEKKWLAESEAAIAEAEAQARVGSNSSNSK